MHRCARVLRFEFLVFLWHQYNKEKKRKKLRQISNIQCGILCVCNFKRVLNTCMISLWMPYHIVSDQIVSHTYHFSWLSFSLFHFNFHFEKLNEIEKNRTFEYCLTIIRQIGNIYRSAPPCFCLQFFISRVQNKSIK